MGTTHEGGVATAVALLASGMGWGPDNGKRGGLEKSVSGGMVTGGWAEVKNLFQIIIVLLLQIITTNTLHGMVACPWRGRKRVGEGVAHGEVPGTAPHNHRWAAPPRKGERE